jgi:hypothetical protein
VKRLVCFAFLALVGQVTPAQTQGAAVDAKNIIGTWVGDWSSYRSGGRLEFEITAFDGASLTGGLTLRHKPATLDGPGFPGRWSATRSMAHNTIGRPCSQVQVVFPFPKGNVIEGSWTSEYPGYGTFR